MPEIVPLMQHLDRSGFDCGVKELNHFLKVTARQHGDKREDKVLGGLAF